MASSDSLALEVLRTKLVEPLNLHEHFSSFLPSLSRLPSFAVLKGREAGPGPI
jgi:hypothetical protein